jgi:hypothetical protein
MKIAFKIIIGCIWFAFVVLFSIYCNDWFSDFINLIERKIIHAEIPPEIDFAINVIPWNCFISFLICLPLLFVKKRQINALREIGDVTVFFFFLLVINILGILIWIMLFPESIGDYSGAPTFSVLEPYALNDGWTPFQFWFAWCAFIFFSNAFSVGMAFFISLSKKSERPLILS